MFPCKNCLVKACCSANCNKLIEDGRVIALYLLSYQTCPDCGNYQIEMSPDTQLYLCRKCRKTFTKQIELKKDDVHILGSFSSSPSSGNSTSVTVTSIGLGPVTYHDVNIITGITKYHKVRLPKKRRNTLNKSSEKIEYIPAPTEKYPRRREREYIGFRRMPPKYTETLTKNMDILTNSRLSVSEGHEIKSIAQVPDWIFKHRNLFIQNPNDPEIEEDYGYIIYTI